MIIHLMVFPYTCFGHHLQLKSKINTYFTYQLENRYSIFVEKLNLDLDFFDNFYTVNRILG